jgi:hypothetical protein
MEVVGWWLSAKTINFAGRWSLDRLKARCRFLFAIGVFVFHIWKWLFNQLLWQVSFLDDLVHPLGAIVYLRLHALDAEKGVFPKERRHVIAIAQFATIPQSKVIAPPLLVLDFSSVGMNPSMEFVLIFVSESLRLELIAGLPLGNSR